MKKVILAAVLFVPGLLFGQDYKLGTISKVIVEGTSTLHDWEMESTKSTGHALFGYTNEELTSIDELEFIVEGETLKSGKSMMDDLTYEALKTEKYPQIKFVLSNTKQVTKVNEGYKITAEGKLTIAGKTNPVTLIAQTKTVDGKDMFTGEYKIDVTEFDMKPPTAMFGTIKTGKEVVVKFEISYTKNGI